MNAKVALLNKVFVPEEVVEVMDWMVKTISRRLSSVMVNVMLLGTKRDLSIPPKIREPKMPLSR